MSPTTASSESESDTLSCTCWKDNVAVPSISSPSASDKSSSSTASSSPSVDRLVDVDIAQKPLIKIYKFEDVFDYIKEYGRYQIFMLVVIQYAMLNAAGNYIFVSFGSLVPTCEDIHIGEIQNPCERISLCPANMTHSVFFSLYEDSNFVCPNSQLPQHIQTIQAIGSGIGALVGGHLADVLGRKWVTFAGALQMFIFGMIGGFAVSWPILASAMFGMGISYGIFVDASVTLASECVGPTYRIVQTLAFQWSLAFQLAALIAYYTATWRGYLIAVNMICAPVLVAIFFWRESPRWLIQKRKFAEAAQEINAMARWNGISTRFSERDVMQIQISTQEDSETVFSLWHLVSNKQLAAYTLVMVLAALTVEMCVAVVIFDVQMLAGSPFVNIALYGLLRMWVPFFVIFVEVKQGSLWFGRRSMFIGSQSFTIICYTLVLLLSILTSSFGSSNSSDSFFFPTQVAKTVLTLLGGIVNSSIFFTVYKQYSIELYPTLMRAMAVGTFGVVERIGGGLAPQLVNMNKWAWPGSGLAVTTFIMLISVIAGALILPETKHSAMPDIATSSSNVRRNDRWNRRDGVSKNSLNESPL